ncbi:MAG: chaperone modulator CbpM [Alphaproteobacteria bacterium]
MAGRSEADVLTGAIVDERTTLTLEQVTVYCATGRETICALVAEGVLAPSGRSEAEWRFAGPTLRRAARAVRLQRDLDIAPHATALVLDLLDEIEVLRARLRGIGGATD